MSYRITAVIYGPWGTGKSWLAQTMPGPRLTFDAEGRVSQTIHSDAVDKVITWDPRDPVPDAGPKDTVVVDVTCWDDIHDAMNVILSGDHPFETLIFDSLTEIQAQLKLAIQPDHTSKFEWDDFRLLKSHGEQLIRTLRDLARPSAEQKYGKRVHSIIVCGVDEEASKTRFLLEGAIRKTLAGFVDIVGYLHQDAEGRYLQIVPDDFTVAKCGLHQLNVKLKGNKSIVNPDMSKIVKAVQ